MCGICGKLVTAPDSDYVDAASIDRMIASLRHRGPDAQGKYTSCRVGLGHTRLSIIDLTSGTQPISNEDGSVWIVYNGEVYNYKELASFLISKGHQFRTTSDTEVIVHLYEEFGEDAIPKLRGMFAFALWDSKTETLLLARDRIGIKPLYYTFTPTSLLFSSEVKAILSDPSTKVAIDPMALDRYLTYLYTPGSATLFKGISKLAPGHYMVVKGAHVTIRQYWDLTLVRQEERGLGDCLEELEALLSQTVRDHMIADVPVGVLLSGGVDSSGVLSFAAEETPQPINTFTIGFDGYQFSDERPFARLAAQKYGTRHYETTITSKEFLTYLPQYVSHMEEPVCEPPAIALYYITRLARQHVIVLLSGEGGDEAFAGYQNYRNLFWLESLKRAVGPLAGPVSKALNRVGQMHGLERFGRYAPLMVTPFEDYYYSRTSSPFQSFNGLKNRLYTSSWRETNGINGTDNGIAGTFLRQTQGLDVLTRMLYVDSKTWLPDDLLLKADKVTMANSLELRVPLLDHRVLEFAARLPRRHKLHGFSTKYILKRVLAGRVPKKILRRKKTGFPVPYESWIRNEFRETVRSVLTDRKTIGRGYFRQRTIENMLDQNIESGCFSKELFSLVTLELWHRVFLDRESVSLS